MYIYSWIIESFILSLSVYYERLFENKKSKSSPHRLTFVFEIDFYLTYFLPGEKKPATTSEFCTPLDKYLLPRDSVPSFFSPPTLVHVKSRSIFIFSRFVRHRGAPFLEVLITNFTSPFPYFRLGIYIYITRTSGRYQLVVASDISVSAQTWPERTPKLTCIRGKMIIDGFRLHPVGEEPGNNSNNPGTFSTRGRITPEEFSWSWDKLE